MKTVDFSETIEACDLKVGRYRQLIIPPAFMPTGRDQDDSRFYTDLEFVRPIYFAINVKKLVRKFTFFR